MFWEVRRKDFLEMFAHHIVTLALITYSYSLGCATRPWSSSVSWHSTK